LAGGKPDLRPCLLVGAAEEDEAQVVDLRESVPPQQAVLAYIAAFPSLTPLFSI
jgi:hypothetical protein